jgi:hypothetical protein
MSSGRFFFILRQSKKCILKLKSNFRRNKKVKPILNTHLFLILKTQIRLKTGFFSIEKDFMYF